MKIIVDSLPTRLEDCLFCFINLDKWGPNE